MFIEQLLCDRPGRGDVAINKTGHISFPWNILIVESDNEQIILC